MGDAHRAFGLVDMLAAGAGGAIDVDAHILFRDVDLDGLVDHRIDGDAGERCVPPRVGIERRDAHQPVHAGFGLQPAIGILALDQQGGGFDARRPRLRFPRSAAACSRAARPSACTCATASRPSPGFRCRRRRHGFPDRCRCRRPRPTAWIPAACCSARLCSASDGIFRVRHHGGVVFGLGHLDQAGWRRPVRSRACVTALSELSSFWRSRISFCAAGGIVPDGGVFGPGVQFVQAAAGGIPVKDASSAGRWPAGFRRRRGRFRGAWRGYRQIARR